MFFFSLYLPAPSSAMFAFFIRLIKLIERSPLLYGSLYDTLIHAQFKKLYEVHHRGIDFLRFFMIRLLGHFYPFPVRHFNFRSQVNSFKYFLSFAICLCSFFRTTIPRL